MKKAVIIFVFCFFLTSCAAQGDSLENKSEVESMENQHELIEDKTKYEEGVYSDKNWDAIEFPIERDCIPDKETAIKVAEIFLLIEKHSNESQNHSYTPAEVFYDIEDMIWIVSFWPYQKGMLIPGDSYSIAMRRINGEVLKMWVE